MLLLGIMMTLVPELGIVLLDLVRGLTWIPTVSADETHWRRMNKGGGATYSVYISAV